MELPFAVDSRLLRAVLVGIAAMTVLPTLIRMARQYLGGAKEDESKSEARALRRKQAIEQRATVLRWRETATRKVDNDAEAEFTAALPAREASR